MRKSFLFVLIIFLYFSCSTEKNKRVNRFYHNTTAYYNGYFNAREIIKEENKVFAKTRKEDYTSILPVNRYPNKEEAESWIVPMDISIEKTSKVITKHAMPKEKVGKYARTEYGKWMDENWLIIGQSNFYKRDYPKAIETFKYVTKMYEKDPSKYKAKLWLAKTYIEMGDFLEANIYLQEIINEKDLSEIKQDKKEATEERRKKQKGKRSSSRIKVIKGREEKQEAKSVIVPFPKELNSELKATLADYYIRKGELKEGLIHLDSAITIAKKRKNKIRYTFIKAQILQELGEKTQAFDNYSYVIKRTAPYQMTFYSKINRALLANSSDRASLKKELLKLAKDDKYIEFKDQIYYALAEIELQEQNKVKGVEYLLVSANSPPSTPTQKGKTYIKLADLYFTDKAYMEAQMYYDSSLSALPETYPNYKNIKEKSISLTELVGHLNNVKLQDSLQEIAKLDEKKRLDRIEEILYAKKIQEEKEKQANALAQNNSNNQPDFLTDNTTKGKFWMYNPQVKTFGYKEFKSVWGDVALEDDWRRKNKNKSIVSGGDELVSNAPVVSDEEIEKFAALLPVTTEQLEKSNNEIMSSLYFAGVIYKDKLNDLPEAILTFNEAKKRFHPNQNVVPSMYQLYKGYTAQNKFDEANAIKEEIIKNYPNSQEAKILIDPLYASKQKSASEKYKNNYQEIYDLVEQNSNDEALIKINTALEIKENPYSCKLLFLKAQAYGNMQELDSVEKALNEVIKQCKGDPLADIAQQAINKKKNIVIARDREQARENLYKYVPTSEHFFVLFVKDGEDIQKIKIALSDFNAKYFKNKELTIANVIMDKGVQSVLIKTFASANEAQDYYVLYKSNKEELKEFNEKLEFFTISALNYSTLFVSKDIAKYKDFYELNYK